MILGIAGKACSGKNAVASLFEEKGYLTVDVDSLGHKALELNKDRVITLFGKIVENSDGSINRKELGSIVFRDKSKLKELELIVHPAIFDMVGDIISKTEGRDIVINAAIYAMIIENENTLAQTARGPQVSGGQNFFFGALNNNGTIAN